MRQQRDQSWEPRWSEASPQRFWVKSKVVVTLSVCWGLALSPALNQGSHGRHFTPVLVIIALVKVNCVFLQSSWVWNAQVCTHGAHSWSLSGCSSRIGLLFMSGAVTFQGVTTAHKHKPHTGIKSALIWGGLLHIHG